jgi:TonB family protein
MARKDKFGKFVLLDQLEATAIGQEYRAAKLGTGGLEKVVSVLKLKPVLSGNAEAVKSLMDQVKFAAQLQNPNILKIYGIGKVEQSYYISYEFVEGKSLKSIFARCQQEGFPFSVDHALLIASKVCSALEYAHGRRTDAGARYFHGQVTPGSVLVSYEGEVRVRDFGVWPSRARDTAGAVPEDAAYLSPEQSAGGGDHRSDIYAVGTLLFETLTGEPFASPERREEAGPRLAKARLQNPTSDDDALPRPIADILHKSLATEPGSRYGEIQEMRKAVDTLLFSGDFTPTTFNLAFFMHSLFREDIERETKALKEEKEASYFEYLTEEPVRAATTPAPAAKPVVSPATTQPVDLRALGITPEPAPAREPSPPPPAPSRTPTPPPVAHPPAPVEAPHPSPFAAEPPPAAPHAFTFHKEGPRNRRLPLIAGGLLVIALAAGGAWWFMRARAARQAAATPAPTTLSAEAQAAALRIQELEQKLQAMETERAAAEAKAAEDAKKKVEQQARAKGQEVDPAALAKAQEEARRKAQAEQERKQAEEMRRLEEERKAEETRLAEERRRAEEEAARLAAAAAATTTLPAPPTTTAPARPAVTPGQLVDLNEAGVIAPVVQRQANPIYPPIALRQRLDGVVELSVLVDERGNVTDAKLVTGAGGKAGLNEAAIDSVKKRKYRPATKDGVPVKVWVPVRVQFRLPS